MKYQAIAFTFGRAGVGYLEIAADVEVPVRLTDAEGVTIEPGVYEYHVTDVDPPRVTWMGDAP